MKAVVYSEPRHFELKEIDSLKCGPEQVLIRVKSCGLCKTDLHIHEGRFISQFPLIPGHEFAGVVEEVGEAVTEARPGDRVVADNTVFCGKCQYCRRKEDLFCENIYSLGVTGPGGFAEYVVVNQEKVFPIPDDLSFDQAAFTEPIACGVHGLDVMDLKFGDDVLIFGAGPTGNILAQLVKNGGAGRVVVCASSQFKLDLIEDLGVGPTVVFDRSDYTRHQTTIMQRFPKGFDVVIDATGAASVVEQCPRYAKHGAKIVVYGVCREEDRISLSPYDIFVRELKIIGSFAQAYCFDRAVKYLENGLVKVDRLISHRFPLEEYGRALEMMAGGGDRAKIVIHP